MSLTHALRRLSLAFLGLASIAGAAAQEPLEASKPTAGLPALTQRGTPTVYRGRELQYIGMPVGGIGAGQLYLGGDGKLWHWDIFNLPQAESLRNTTGPDYATPLHPASPLEQGFALRILVGGQVQVRTLDRQGFRNIAFQGQYPIGKVHYQDPATPVTAALEAFSPFIPLNVEDSSLPATLMHFTVKNSGKEPAEVELTGWLENAVCLGSGKAGTGRHRNTLVSESALTLLHCTAETAPRPTDLQQPDLFFEDFEKETYGGWKVEGAAFGSGPVHRSAVPAYQGDLGGKGQRVVNSHASAPGKTVAERDAQTGKLTSPTFTIRRSFIHFYIGGGNQEGKTCINVVVGGQRVRTATGRNDNRMRLETFDVHDFLGKEAVLEIVDAATGPWGNIGVDHIVFSDVLPESLRLEHQVDFGSLALALLGREAGDFALTAVPLDGSPAHAIFPPRRDPSPHAVRVPFGTRLAGALGRKWRLEPGGQAEAVFVVTWYFPSLPRGYFGRLQDAPRLRRSYANRFDSAAAVARYVAAHRERLVAHTRLWSQTWYDSTLPHWFLDRTFLTTGNLASATCYRFTNGRFYGFEGVYCCDGTCTHVWHYAQAVARLFPELERTTREKVDFGLAFHPDTGAMDYRGEYGRQVAVDGQAGTILRAYREHQMSADASFLRRTWPRIKKSLEYLIARDPHQDGILEGEQYNTLDASWYGEIPWLSSLYLASVRAGAAMAREMGDEAFQRRCEDIASAGFKRLVERLFNGEYFVQRVDPAHREAINTNDGCHIDQVLGQSWAFQVGLPRVLPEGPTRSALSALWKHNYLTDIGPYRRGMRAIPGGRWYALPGEGGLLMCTWPRGGADKAAGKGNPAFVGYFNECMTGFEYQVAAHMIWEGLVEQGLAITRTIHDRYGAARRNPWNEIECADHYARSMASYGVFLAACGYEYHGPQRRIGFAPRLTPEHFRAAFTAAEGWGSFAQTIAGGRLQAELSVKWGRLPVREFVLQSPGGRLPSRAEVTMNGRIIPCAVAGQASRVSIRLADELTVTPGKSVQIALQQ